MEIGVGVFSLISNSLLVLFLPLSVREHPWPCDRSVHSVFNLLFLHKQKNSYNSRLSKINTIKIELQNKYSIQRKPSVVTFDVG